MLVWFEILIAIIVVAVRHYRKNKSEYQSKIKRIILKLIATLLAILLAITVLLQEVIQRILDKVSIEEKKLRQPELNSRNSKK